MSSSKAARHTQILKHLYQNGSATVEALCGSLRVSDMTIRRDLDSLEKAGKVYRFRGGANLTEQFLKKGVAGLIQSEDDEGSDLPQRPDILILNPMDRRMARILIQEASHNRIPIIAESIPFEGISTLIAIDSFQAGLSLGNWIGQYIRNQKNSSARVLFVGLPTYNDTAERARGFFEGLGQIIPQLDFSMTVNGQGMRQSSSQVIKAALTLHPDINIVVGVNDQSAMGALDAVKELGLPIEKFLIGTFGLEGHTGKGTLLNECPHCVGVAMFPELIGRICADVAVKTFNNLPLPKQIITPTAIISKDTLTDYYQFSDGEWAINWDAVLRLPGEFWTSEAAVSNSEKIDRYPQRIDFVRYLHDEYYEQLVSGLQERASEWDISVQVRDASTDMEISRDITRRAIAKKAVESIQSGESIILDSGKTNAYLARNLAERREHKFTVITNSIPVIKALHDAEHITLITIGGLLHRPSQSFLGVQAEAALRDLQADKAFLGVAGIDAEHGISNMHLEEANFKRGILKAAKEIIVLADSFKIGQIAFARIASLTAVHKLITDDQISSQDKLSFNKAGLEVILTTNNSV